MKQRPRGLRMNLPRLYAITDEAIVPNEELFDKVRVVLDAGVRLIQLRFKKTPHAERLELSRRIRELTRDFGAVLIMDDSPELARSIQADGVHLGIHDPRVGLSRRVLGSSAVIGITCYDRPERVAMWGEPVISYLGLSSPYPSPTKPKVMPSLDEFKELIKHARVPVYAIGGITPERVGEMMHAGCYGVAAISAIFAARDPAEAVSGFLAELESFPFTESESPS
ncbi:thiamine phosphate synthase [candidate division WOR-3 bacterium]|uniref:Thiamine-phosphate synthase n=1 Tax=candidate division WOR-3 bacterium TaxID=2052148 RepID=A0A9D5KC41_UNCW3|nr:thiamine phosphate synthase [candidate division WOR-3 bacterium]MBD3365335.1 thiamine phosphate synthase [candidate division WOR-3 bacterium]